MHVYGVPTIVDEAMLKQIIFDTTEKYESSMQDTWTIPLSEREVDAMLKAIVGFTIEITRVEAKFKLGQNRSKEDQESMLNALQQSTDSGNRDLAEFIKSQLD